MSTLNCYEVCYYFHLLLLDLSILVSVFYMCVYLLLSIDLAFSSLRVEESSIHVLYSCAFYLLSAIYVSVHCLYSGLPVFYLVFMSVLSCYFFVLSLVYDFISGT